MWREAIQSARESFTVSPSVELIGGRLAIARGCEGILEYDTEKITIGFADYALLFWGDALTIRELSKDCLEISGNILRVEYQAKRQMEC